MKRTQLYLDDDIAKVLKAVSRQTGTTISSLVRDCVREKFGQREPVDRVAMARELAGIWKDRDDLGTTSGYVRRLRKGSRLKKLSHG
jgi:hypothetical protein